MIILVVILLALSVVEGPLLLMMIVSGHY